MLVQLSALQCRVIGVLLEKEITTPDQYPLSLNALTLGCNQKSNRDPVLSLEESEVLDVVNELMDMKLINEHSGFGSRVSKYKHRFCNTEFGDLKFTRQQLGIVCVLLLRGPQTPGELRTRTNRLAEFTDVNEVEQTLEYMKALNDECIVVKLPKEPGKRDSRYMHLFSGDPDLAEIAERYPTSSHSNTLVTSPLSERVHALEEEVKSLKEQVESIHEVIKDLM